MTVSNQFLEQRLRSQTVPTAEDVVQAVVRGAHRLVVV